MSPQSAMPDDLPDDLPLALRLAFPGPAVAGWPFAAMLPAVEIAAVAMQTAVMVGWAAALGPWRVRVSIERRREGRA